MEGCTLTEIFDTDEFDVYPKEVLIEAVNELLKAGIWAEFGLNEAGDVTYVPGPNAGIK